MSAPLSSWLRSVGCTSVYAEVPFVLREGPKAGTRHIDLIGIAGDILVAVEMKKSLCWSLMRQGISLQRAIPIVYCAVSCRPIRSSIDEFRRAGLGILIVQKDLVSEFCPPRPSKQLTEQQKLKIEKGVLNGIAGLPTGGYL